MSRPVDAAHRVDAAAARVLVLLVRAYQLLLSPLVGPVCRYAPSCSSYAAQALTEHGGARGTALVVRRLLRCHPWAAGGWDPVPTAPHPAGRRARRGRAEHPARTDPSDRHHSPEPARTP